MEYTLKVNVDELRVIAAGLNELARKVSQPVFERLQAQVEEQDRAQVEEQDRARREEAEKAEAANQG